MIGTRLLDRYELSRELGRGGMGIVYQAHDPYLQRDVAVKVIPSERLTPEAEERFQREARLVAAMDHPAIVPIHDFGRHEGSLFFVMPWVRGQPLRHDIRRGQLELGSILDIAIQVAEALDYSHVRGVVHRDIKPENVMVNRDSDRPRIRLLDLGLAQGSSAERLTASGGLVGTLAYLSPEQVASAEIDGRSDLYSLGVLLYESLLGKPPFSGTIYSLLYRISNEPAKSLVERGLAIEEDLDKLILSCLAKDPAKRPQRGRELADALRLHHERYAATGDDDSEAVHLLGQAIGAELAGREAEVELLAERLALARQGECQIVVVGGEAGIGKTRLLDELVDSARRQQVLVLRGRIADRESPVAYQGFCDLIQDYFRQRRSASLLVPEEAIELNDLATDLVELFPALSEIPELRAASHAAAEEVEDLTEPLPMIDFGGRSSFVFELLSRTLARFAADNPLVVVLEDLHTGEASIEALRYLLHRLVATPLLLAVSYRPGEVERSHPMVSLLKSLQGDPRAGVIQLQPLAVSDLRSLVETELKTAGIPQDVIQRLHEITEGNPHFARELVRALAENGDLARGENGIWQLRVASGTSSEALPATLRQAVERRVERLSVEQRQLLSTASVLGRTFEFKDLEHLMAFNTDAQDPDGIVDALLQSGLLQEETKRRGDWLTYSSGLMREVLYSQLSRRKQRSLHRAHAFALEERHRGHEERVSARLLHHFQEGGVAERTVHYALRLARESLNAASPDDAVQAAQAGLEMVPDVIDTPRAEGELRAVLARAYRTAGENDKALREARRAVEALGTAGALESLASTALLGAEIAWHQRAIEEVGLWVERGVEPARQCRADQILRKLLTYGATVVNLRGDYKAGQELLAEAEELLRTDPTRSTGTGSTAGIPLVGGKLTVAFRLPVHHVAPAGVKTVEEQEISANVFETLVITDEEGTQVPWLCHLWQHEDEHRSFIIDLRPDAHFSDGVSLTAEHVKAAFEETARLCAYSLPEALACLRGAAAFTAGENDEINGIEVLSERRIHFHLDEPLPIFPALLTDPKTAVFRSGSDGKVGTGPFSLKALDPGHEQQLDDVGHRDEGEPGRVVLQRDISYWRDYPATLEKIEFVTGMDGRAIAAGLRSGQVDIGRDLLPDDLDDLMRDLRFRRRLAEATMHNIFFLLFNQRSRLAQSRDLREALAVLRTGLVWRTLGRFAQPASSLVPPGVLGHDPERRWPSLTRERSLELIARSGLERPIRLRAAIHPILSTRFAAFLDAFLSLWSDLGVEVENVTPTMRKFLSAWGNNDGIDFLLSRWSGEFDDPDSYTYGLFHSRFGKLRLYYGSPESDRILEQARSMHSGSERCRLYQEFESLVAEEAWLLPLFYDVDYRLARPVVRGLRLQATLPFVHYNEVSKLAREARERPHIELGGGEISTVLTGRVTSLDPVADAVTETSSDQQEACSTVFETLTRIDQGARVVPWLAASCQSLQDGAAYRFRLRPNIRFHDGRRLTVRDVRFSLERATRVSSQPLLPIRGADALRRGEREHLEGIRLVSASELVLELDQPLSFFPALLAQIQLAILPEGTETIGSDWRHGCVGTGPFRVVQFQAGERLDLEKNSLYWRPARPKSDRLLFYLGADAAEAFADFRSGRLSLVSGLRPLDVDALCHDPAMAGSYHESPRLATAFLAFNQQRATFAEKDRRQALCQALDAAALVRETMGRLGTVATGLIPPGLLGADSQRQVGVRRPHPENGHTVEELAGRSLRVAVGDVFRITYATFWERLRHQLEALQIELETVTVRERQDLERCDLILERWDARYPDADSFAMGLIHRRDGRLGMFCGSAETDRLAEEGRFLPDREQRHEVYRQLEQVIAEEGLLLPLFHEHSYRFRQAKLRGLRTDFSLPGVRYEDLTLRSS